METIATWFEGNMLTCPSKSIAGIECPGCGFQRGFADLLRGDLAGTWEHYPPLFPFLLTLVLLGFFLLSKYRYRTHLVVGSFLTTTAFIIGNYLQKMF